MEISQDSKKLIVAAKVRPSRHAGGGAWRSWQSGLLNEEEYEERDRAALWARPELAPAWRPWADKKTPACDGEQGIF